MKYACRVKLSGQKGAVLITALVILGLLTIMTATALRNGGLGERMASNLANRQIALQAAESVARDAQTAITADYPGKTIFQKPPFEPWKGESVGTTIAMDTDSICTGGICMYNTNSPRWLSMTAADWADAANTRSFSGVINFYSLGDVVPQPRYIIEIILAPTQLVSGKSNNCSNGIVQITAKGYGPDSATALIKSQYRYIPKRCFN